MAETVIVFKDIQSREIRTYVHLDGHGAEMTVTDFVSRVAELYGSPALTLTRAGLLAGLQAAAAQTIYEMKSATKEVAAVNLSPEK